MKRHHLIMNGMAAAVASTVLLGVVPAAQAKLPGAAPKYAYGTSDSEMLCKKMPFSKKEKVRQFLTLRWMTRCNMITEAQFDEMAPTGRPILEAILATPPSTVTSSSIDISLLPQFDKGQTLPPARPPAPVYNDLWKYPVFVADSELAASSPGYMTPYGAVVDTGNATAQNMMNISYGVGDDGDVIESPPTGCPPRVGTVPFVRDRMTYVAKCDATAFDEKPELGHAAQAKMGIGIVQQRCFEQDPVWTETVYSRRLNWAHQCKLITEEEFENALFVRVGNGLTRLAKTDRLYPSFTHYPDPSSINEQMSAQELLSKFVLWTPETMPVTANGGDFLPHEVVDDISENPWEHNSAGDPYHYQMTALKPNDLTGNFDDCRKPADVHIFSLCKYGCFAPEQKVLFSSGEMAIEQAVEEQKLDIVTLDPDATFDDMKLMTNKVFRYTADVVPQAQKLVEIHTESGHIVRVTPGHPLITEDGTIRFASDFQVGERLVRKDGTFEAITSLATIPYTGKVYNVNPVTLDETSNVLVDEGYLSASHRYQTPAERHLNRKMIRRTVPDWALER